MDVCEETCYNKQRIFPRTAINLCPPFLCSLATEHDTCTSLAGMKLTNITNCLGSLGWAWSRAWAEAAALELGHINYNKSYSCCALAERQRQRRPTVDCTVQTKPNQVPDIGRVQSQRPRRPLCGQQRRVSNCRAIKLPLPGQQVKRPAAPGPLWIHRLRIPSFFFWVDGRC